MKKTRHLVSQASEPNVDLAVKAYKTIIRNDIEDVLKYSSYQQLFSYVKRPEDLYDVFRQIEGRTQNSKTRRLTFNELVIEFGSLIIVLEDQLSHDQKLDVLIEIFNVFSFLNDINKGKKSIVNRLVSAEQIVLETPGIHYEKWIQCKDEIQRILSESIIGNNTQDVDKWLVPIDECLNICLSNNSEMGLLFALENWRHNLILLSSVSNFENAFIRAVEEKILELKSGINLSITINNTTIEDNSVFFQITNTSPSNNVSVILNNKLDDAAHLVVEIGVNNSTLEKFEDAEFSNELILRPNDSCGQCYKMPSRITRQLQNGDVVTVIVNIIYSGKIICNNKHQQNKFKVETINEALVPSILSNRVHYGTAVPAFSASIKGFGREREKSDLKELLESNLAIIYGPSRVGKSSLLNYIANEYFNDYCTNSERSSIMQIRVADEQFSKNDYVSNMLSEGEPLHFESSDQIIEYLFCAPLSIAFSEESSIRKMQMCRTGISSFPDEARAEILEILSINGSIVGKYGAISRILSNCNCELWIMFDEFQQIVERWKGSADELAELCTFIKYNQISNSIKLVFCGSDDLVRIFECVHDDNWDEFKVKTADTWVFVGQLSGKDFASMMNDRTIWKHLPEATPWNMSSMMSDDSGDKLPAVLQSLYDYTGGNAICGKIFGEELLEKVKSGKFAHRRFFYPADITQIAYELLNTEASKLKSLLITHTTKNLRNELPYLLYIANELSSDINRSDISLRRILEFFVTKESADVETALKVLIARGIIKTTTEPHRYGFTTLFYFDFFKDLATDSVMEKLKSSERPDVNVENRTPWLDQVVEIVRSQPIVDRADLVRIIDARDDDDLKEGIGELYGKTYIEQYIKENTGTSIGRQNNVQVNVQNITNTLNGIFAATDDPNKMLEGLRSLPRLDSYLPQFNSGEDNHEISEARLSRAIDGYVADLEEGMETSIEQSGASLVPLWSILKITEDEFSDFMNQYMIPQCFMESLQFAYQLGLLFENGSLGRSATDIDYSPVTIMYCKLSESMLKEYHIIPYSKAISSFETDMVNIKERPKKYLWGDIRKLPQYQQQKLTIGSFVFPIVVSKGVTTVEVFDNIADLANDTEGTASEWRQHASFIKEIRDIRNPSAHGNKNQRITVGQLKNITKLLIDDGGFLRLVRLVKKPI